MGRGPQCPGKIRSLTISRLQTGRGTTAVQPFRFERKAGSDEPGLRSRGPEQAGATAVQPFRFERKAGSDEPGLRSRGPEQAGARTSVLWCRSRFRERGAIVASQWRNVMGDGGNLTAPPRVPSGRGMRRAAAHEGGSCQRRAGECFFQLGLSEAQAQGVRMAERNARRTDFRIDDIAVNLLSLQHALHAIIANAQQGRGFCVFTLNLDHCTKLRSDAAFRWAYRRANFVTADGFPIAVLGRVHGVPVKRTTGADLVEPICREAAALGLPVFLVGPNAFVLRRAQARLRGRNSSLNIVGVYAPGPGFDPWSLDADLAIERIRQSGARLCLVAIGAPRQEIFAARSREQLPGVGFVCVGAALDFIAGTQTRAPAFFQRCGLEWLWRLSTNPRRLTLRYLRCAAAVPRLAVRMLPQAIAIRIGRHS